MNDLEEALCEAPGDVQRVLVYADWLQERGDPLGRSLARACDPAQAAAAERFHAQLLPLDDLEEAARPVLRWRHGLVESVQLQRAPGDGVGAGQALEAVLSHPTGRFVSSIEVGLWVDWGALDADEDPHVMLPVIGGRELDALAAAMVAHPPRALRQLALSVAGAGPVELHGLHELLAAAPRLETLRLTFVVPPPGWRDEVPRLRTLVMEVPGMPASALEAVGASRWPALETLSLTLGDDGGLAASSLAAILGAGGLPRLRHLGINGCTLGDDLVELLAASPLPARLAVLDLRECGISDAGASVLAGMRLAHLEALHLGGNAIRRVELLAGLEGIVTGLGVQGA